MRRAVTLLLSLSLILIPYVASAQNTGQDQTYQSDALGISFQYPADWQVNEQLSARTVTAASKLDMDALNAGKAPAGLLFTISVSNFRLMGVQGLDDFAARLQTIAGAPNVKPMPAHIAGVDGLSIEVIDQKNGIASRTAILSIGNRRAAVIRGVATTASWKAGASQQLDKLVGSLSFAPPAARDNLDAFGEVLWQLPVSKLTNMVSLTAAPDGTSIYVSDQDQGIWQIGADATLGGNAKPANVASFGAISMTQDSTLFIADPTTHAIWQMAPGKTEVTKFVDGKAGAGAGEFGAQSPQSFDFGLRGSIYVLDQAITGGRIEVFNNQGVWTATWPLPNATNPLIASDATGNGYILGSDGIVKLSSAGKVVSSGIGKIALSVTTPLAMVVDQTNSFYVATADDGILKLDETGNLIGVVGEPYDEAAAPKPGQIGKPVALALAEDDRVLYVADSGKFPQIVAFGLNGKHAVNIAAGTRDAGKIVYGQTVDGEITQSAFIFNYGFDARGGDTISITMRASDDRQLDPYIELIGYSPGGSSYRLAFNDDAQGDELGPRDAQIKSFHIRFDGTYTIRVTRFGAETTTGTGQYSLNLALEAKPTPSSPPTAGPSPTPTQEGIRAQAATFTPTAAQ